MEEEHQSIAQELRSSILAAKGLTKRMKVRSLLSKFGFQKRSDANTGLITEALGGAGVVINPAIIRLGDDWQLDIDEWIFLSSEEVLLATPSDVSVSQLTAGWNADGWFDRLESLNLRSEKEVEIKLIVPLLTRLGYSDDDRYDGMPCAASMGSRKTTYTADFALHNVEESALKGQVLLIAEAKKEDRLKRPTEMQNAFRQAKSYAMWTQCRHLLVTDGRLVVAYEILRAGLEEGTPVFSCQRQELKVRFPELFAKVSKPVLTRFYMKLVSAVEEAR